MMIEPDFTTFLYLALAVIAVVGFLKGFRIVPQQEAWIVETLGKFDRKLEPGLNLLIPYVQRLAYKHTLKEDAIDVPAQAAITNDNVTLKIDGVLYVRIIDPVAASYGVSDPYYALTQLAQTTMRSEIGKLTLDKTFEERDRLNTNIVTSINEAAKAWGIQCMRYEIKDINPPQNVLNSMEQQVAAERNKRAHILESEGQRQSQINISEGQKQQVLLQSEGAMMDQINRAKGEAEAIKAVAEATAHGIRAVAAAIQDKGGSDAVSLRVAEQYVEAFKQLAKNGNSVIVPANVTDISGTIAQALTVFDNLRNTRKTKAS